MNRFLQNIRRPEGFGGSVAAFLMNHKHATLSDWGISRLNLKEEKDILDIGCGGGRNLAALLERCRHRLFRGKRSESDEKKQKIY